MSDQQVMVITGTRKGIGKYIVEHYVRNGYQVVGCSRQPVNYHYKTYRHFSLDVSDEIEVKQMLSEIYKSYKRLDILINNAGIAAMNYVLLTPLATVQDILNTNFIGTFLFCREAAKIMQKNRYGRIVNISSIDVPLGTVGGSIYSSSKAAVEQFSRVLSKEFASYGITVNILALSLVKDSGMVAIMSEKAIKETLQRTHLKSWLNFEDVGHALDFFISPKSNMVTGQTLCLGGV